MKRACFARLWAGGILALATCAVVRADETYAGVEARLSTPVLTVNPGKPIRVHFAIYNTTDHPVTLSVPGATAMPPEAAADLPESHVFSGTGFSGLTIRGDFDRTWKDALGVVPPAEAPELVLAPHAFVGREIDVGAYYPAMQTPGLYRLVWQPYGGLLTSNQLTVEVAALKQAEIITDEGTLTVQFYYDAAPNHVANFIELARNSFYDQKTFHRIEPGYFIQGGCPNGDGSGIRPDGKKLKAEFNSYPVDRGTLCMARLESEPDSASCQFLIANTRMPNWDGRYSVFGHIIGEESEQTLDKLMNQSVNAATGRPQRTIFMRSVRIVDAPLPEEITGVRGGGFAETER